MSDKINSFLPVIDQYSKVLVLGSIPGVKSLQEQRYYAHPQNQFWRIIYALFGLETESDYESRLRFLKERRIGLWDVIANCKRSGSLDSQIKEEKLNDLPQLFASYPDIRFIAFNGAKAYSAFFKNFGLPTYIDNKRLDFERLPSTSPAYTLNFEEKLARWKSILPYLC